MSNRIAWWLALIWWLVVFFLGTLGGSATGPAAVGQQPAPPRQLPASVQQAGFTSPPVSPAVAPPGLKLADLPPAAQEILRGARGGTEWLCRAHQPSGRFLPGWRPDLHEPVEGDHFLRQAGATLALARSARVFQDERYAARARQAVLTLLAETGPDPSDPASRCTTLPSAVVNRLGAAGVLLAAICELPDPAKDLLDQGEELARFIARRQQPDGSFRCTDTPEEVADPDGVNHHPGAALYGLMRSQALRPAPWKAEAARKALGYYRTWWRDEKHKHPAFAASQSAAFAEAFVQSKGWTANRQADPAYAAFVFELCDWLCTLQVRQLDPRHPLWRGGFPEFAQGRPLPGAPTATSAVYAAALVEACRVTRQLPDAERYNRYGDSAFGALQFMTTLQYTEANTQHFAPAYRQQVLLGGFHTSHEDGTLRLEHTGQAVTSLVRYWECVAQPELATKK
ncbi:MAG TPA: hypothetical protein VGF55_20540 [Gemmataceae bacterium]